MYGSDQSASLELRGMNELISVIKKMSLSDGENKLGYIYGFTDNYVKVRHPWSPKLSNKVVQAKLTDIDNDGFVRIKLSEKKQRMEKQYLYSDSNW